jgi:hypothetical protein
MNATFQVYEARENGAEKVETLNLPALPTQADVLGALGLSNDGEYRGVWVEMPRELRIDTKDGLTMFNLVRL